MCWVLLNGRLIGMLKMSEKMIFDFIACPCEHEGVTGSGAR
jgi:hypothetical protein